MRKPVHVETGIWQTDSGEIANALYSFCDDGTMWELREDVWRRLPDIPQDEPEQERQSYVRMSADEVGVLLNIAVAAHRVVAKYDAGERPVNVESLRARLSALGQNWIEAHGGLKQPATSPDVVKALRELAKAERKHREACEKFGFYDLETRRLGHLLRLSGRTAREMLKRIDEQEEPR